jgi:hypothetical protein
MSKAAQIEAQKAQAMQEQADTLLDLQKRLARMEEKIDALLGAKPVPTKAKTDKPSA